MIKLKHLAAILAVGGALFATGAQATALFFSFTSTTGDETWYQTVPSHVGRVVVGSNTSVSVYDATGFIGGLTAVTYYLESNASAGGFGLYNGHTVESFHGPTIFTNTLQAPVFSPTGGNPIALDGGGTLTITAVPEPAAWALMLTGVFGLGAVLRARRVRFLAAA
jgi:hypothetical protein